MAAGATSTMVGPYRVDGLIGRGGMGEVHRAYDTRRERTVALKLLPAAVSGDAEFRERFRRESLIAASLTSPHVVPIHDFGDVEGRLFIDMRLIEGADLTHLLAGRTMEPQRAVSILVQVCNALADAHAHGVVHRDVKPSNILLTSSDFAYLVDFGIAASDDAGPSLTATGNTVGTFGYMAPERFDGRPADASADIYSLGCVLHEMLTGSRPFADQSSTPSLIRAHLMLEPSPPSRSGAPVPPALDQAVLRALAKAPEHRHASVTELANALRASIAIPSPRHATITSFAAHPTPQAYIPTGQAPQSSAPTPEPPRTRLAGARKAALVGSAIALLGIGVGTGVAVSNSGPDPVSSSPTATAPSPASSRPTLTGLLGGSRQNVEPVAFGQSQQPRTGITATAGAPTPYTASSTAASADGAERMASVEVTLTNNTDRYINFGEQFSSKLEIDDAWTMPVLDIANNVGSGPRLQAVAPGASSTFTVVWALPARPVPITLQLSPLSFRGGSGQPVSWTGEA